MKKLIIFSIISLLFSNNSFAMSSLDFSNPEVIETMTDSALFWVEEYELDGFRHDATKHIQLEFWRTLTRKVKEEIVELKKKFSSSSLTSLQKTAESGQKWPLLNLVRQVLKTCNYQMKPIRRSDGYKKDGKKKYKRFFLIGKYTSTKNTIVPQVDPSANPISVVDE